VLKSKREICMVAVRCSGILMGRVVVDRSSQAEFACQIIFWAVSIAIPSYAVCTLKKTVICIPFVGCERMVLGATASSGYRSLCAMERDTEPHRSRRQFELEYLHVRIVVRSLLHRNLTSAGRVAAQTLETGASTQKAILLIDTSPLRTTWKICMMMMNQWYE
jgi:hypothetical protein